ncbi:ABC transporter B family member 15 [Sesamum alatum]|uniref:ABC transporter B family member 15 n=1 Tax=Sesamum alatum TaxID=300844 RepID=A0AAE1Y6A9_9LAMI|nr:ABC transporter B family member 15 [Sesamum alatum]
MGTKCALFRFADAIDKLLMFLGAMGSVGEGLAAPMTMYVLSGAIDAFGTADQSIANEVLDKYGLRLLYVAFGVGFSCFLGVGFGKLMMDMGIKSKDAYGIAGSIVEQAISNIRKVYSYVGEQKTVDKFSRALEDSMNLGIKQGLMKGLMIGSMGMIFATWAFQSWVGGLLVTEKGESGGHVLYNCSTECAPFIVDASAAAKRIFEMIDRVPEIDSGNGKGKVFANVRGQFEFREVYFSYPSRKDEPVLQGLSLKVKPGEKVGLAGGSGSGKSTIVSLLERFYDPIKGDILLDGHRIKRLQLKWLRSQFALVNQEPVLFATSIKQNILFGKEDAPPELVMKAAKAANAHDFIVEFPQGYDT